MKENQIFKNKEDVKQTLDNVNNWISNCDTKTSIILGVIGVIISLLLSFDYIDTVYKIVLKLLEVFNLLSFISVLIIVFSIILLIIGVVYLIKVLLAKTNLEGINKNGLTKNSILFFSSISENEEFSTYKKKLLSYTEEDWLNDYAS